MKRILLSIIAFWSVAVHSSFGIVQNPMLWADVPDPDVIRVGDYYYLVTTTMHLMPGGPIMRSKDWKTRPSMTCGAVRYTVAASGQHR